MSCTGADFSTHPYGNAGLSRVQPPVDLARITRRSSDVNTVANSNSPWPDCFSASFPAVFAPSQAQAFWPLQPSSDWSAANDACESPLSSQTISQVVQTWADLLPPGGQLGASPIPGTQVTRRNPKYIPPGTFHASGFCLSEWQCLAVGSALCGALMEGVYRKAMAAARTLGRLLMRRRVNGVSCADAVRACAKRSSPRSMRDILARLEALGVVVRRGSQLSMSSIQFSVGEFLFTVRDGDDFWPWLGDIRRGLDAARQRRHRSPRNLQPLHNRPPKNRTNKRPCRRVTLPNKYTGTHVPADRSTQDPSQTAKQAADPPHRPTPSTPDPQTLAPKSGEPPRMSPVALDAGQHEDSEDMINGKNPHLLAALQKMESVRRKQAERDGCAYRTLDEAQPHRLAATATRRPERPMECRAVLPTPAAQPCPAEPLVSAPRRAFLAVFGPEPTHEQAQIETPPNSPGPSQATEALDQATKAPDQASEASDQASQARSATPPRRRPIARPASQSPQGGRKRPSAARERQDLGDAPASPPDAAQRPPARRLATASGLNLMLSQVDPDNAWRLDVRNLIRTGADMETCMAAMRQTRAMESQRRVASGQSLRNPAGYCVTTARALWADRQRADQAATLTRSHSA